MRKPSPPTPEQLDREFLARQAAALGIGVQFESNDDRIFRYLVEHCRREGRTPRLDRLSADLGLHLSTASDAIRRLRRSGRISVPRRGVYIPNTVK